jgi:hypothetical protein
VRSRKLREFTKSRNFVDVLAHIFSIIYKMASHVQTAGGDQKCMLRIQRSCDRRVVLSLSGRIEAEDVAELQRLIALEAIGQTIAFDLRDVVLVDRDAVMFLARWESEGIELENCPAYVREWFAAERNRGDQ